MKNILLICGAIVSLAFSEEDPFSDVYAGKTAESVSWERILVDDSQFDGKVILMDGFIKVSKVGNNCIYYLFIDSESLKYARPMRCILINSEKLDSVLAQNSGMNFDDKLKLTGKYVKILGIYKKGKKGEKIGSIGPPISVYFKEGEVSIPKNGVVHVPP